MEIDEIDIAKPLLRMLRKIYPQAEIVWVQTSMVRGYLLLALKEGASFRFKCTHCGECCQALEFPLSKNDIERLRDFIGEKELRKKIEPTIFSFLTPEGNLKRLPGYKIKRRNGYCVFWDGDSCSIYEHRPWACRMYPIVFLPLAPEGYFYLDISCPGILSGKEYRLEEYLKEMKVNYETLEERIEGVQEVARSIIKQAIMRRIRSL